MSPTKDASNTHVSTGLAYLANFVSPYRLWIPLILLLAAVLLAVGRRLDRADIVRCSAAVASAVLMAGYVIAIGGDFMHARMLLPPTFALLMPVMMLPLPKLGTQAARAAVSALCAVAIGVWAVACAAALRDHAGITKTGIDDERAYWVAHVHQGNPDTAAEYVQAILGTRESTISRYATSGTPVLLYSVITGGPYVAVPLNRPGYSVATAQYLLGTAGAGTPLDGLVVDQRGLSYALGAHEIGDPNARPGHTRWVTPVWIVADYSNVTSAPGIPAAQLAAARKAISCGKLAQLNQATAAPLTTGRFVSNFFHSLSLTTFRFSPDPFVAEKELCG